LNRELTKLNTSVTGASQHHLLYTLFHNIINVLSITKCNRNTIQVLSNSGQKYFTLLPVLHYGYNGTPFVLTALHQPAIIKFLCAHSESNLPGGVYEKFPVSEAFSDVNHSMAN
jgi:hypothetical protein